jgi:hypothetical protein
MTSWANQTAGLMRAAVTAFADPVVLSLLDEAGDPLDPVSLSGVFFEPMETVVAEGEEVGFDRTVPSLALALADVPARLMESGGWKGATVVVRSQNYTVTRRPETDGQAGLRLSLRVSA